MKRYDVVVLGSGPAGEGAAMMAAKAGKTVAVVDRRREVGGACVHHGTIPSKVLRHEVEQYRQVRNHPLYAHALEEIDVEFPDLLKAARDVIGQQSSMRRDFYERNDVRFYDGHGRFTGPHSIDVVTELGQVTPLEAEHVVLAVGSSPWHPDGIDFAHPRVRDANTILCLEETPNSVVIVGAGVIGCEYTSIFRQLRVKVNLVNNRETLLDFLDDEISDALSYHLRDQGAIIRQNEQFASVEAHDDHVVLHLESGKRIKGDYLLWAAGRSGNTRSLQLDKAGLEPNRRAQLDVNAYYQTAVPHIYAVGDVVGRPGLASASYDQGRFAAEHIVRGRTDLSLVEYIPTGIYTTPEISTVGATERELTEKKIPYEVGLANFRNLARAQIERARVGMLKLLFHTETYALLGIHCFGHDASEIVHIGQAVFAQKGAGNDVRYFVDTTFNYPTMAEAYRTAALNGLNRMG